MIKISLIDKGAVTDHALSRRILEEAMLTSDLICEWPWTAMVLKEGQTWLKQDNFLKTQLLVLDIDNSPESGKLSLHDAVELFKDYKHIIGTSRNHQKDKVTTAGKVKPAADRYRVVLFFDVEITDISTYKQNWEYYVGRLNLQGIVDQTLDVARYFLPCTNIVSETDGELLSVQSLRKGRSLKEEVKKEIPVGAKGKLSKSTLEFISQIGDNLQNWHVKRTRAAFDCSAQNYSIDEARELLTKASPTGDWDKTDEYQLQDVYKRQALTPPRPANWPEVTQHGEPKRHSVKNLEHIIKNVLGYNLFYDERSARIVKSKPFGEVFSETDNIKVRYKCLESQIMDEPNKVDVVITHEALAQSYDPFKNVLESVTWDGKDHIKQLFQTLIFDSDESEHNLHWYEQYLTRWLRAIAAKYYDPGSQNNVLVFVGTQGVGKSRWFERLTSLWSQGLKEGPIDPSNKDHALGHLEKFVWHIAELDNTTNNKDVNAVKEFLTRGSISERRPYARKPDTGKSICSFCASVNSTDFLHDSSGNRRFLVLPILKVLPDHKVNIPQVFAQAAAEYKAGKPWYFTNEENKETEKLTDMFKYKDPVIARIEQRIRPGEDRVSIHEIVEAVKSTEDNYSYISSKPFKTGVSNLLLKMNYPWKNHSNTKVYLVDLEALKGKKNN